MVSKILAGSKRMGVKIQDAITGLCVLLLDNQQRSHEYIVYFVQVTEEENKREVKRAQSVDDLIQ
jgi:hypothetical protein